MGKEITGNLLVRRQAFDQKYVFNMKKYCPNKMGMGLRFLIDSKSQSLVSMLESVNQKVVFKQRSGVSATHKIEVFVS